MGWFSCVGVNPAWSLGCRAAPVPCSRASPCAPARGTHRLPSPAMSHSPKCFGAVSPHPRLGVWAGQRPGCSSWCSQWPHARPRPCAPPAAAPLQLSPWLFLQPSWTPRPCRASSPSPSRPTASPWPGRWHGATRTWSCSASCATGHLRTPPGLWWVMLGQRDRGGRASRSRDPPLCSELCQGSCNGSSGAPGWEGVARCPLARPAQHPRGGQTLRPRSRPLLEAGASTALAPAATRSPASSARLAPPSAVASSSACSTTSRCGAGGAQRGATGASGAWAGTTPPMRKVGAEAPGGPLCPGRRHSRGGMATLTPLSSLPALLLLQPPRGSWTPGGALGRPGRAGGWRCSCAGR